MIDERELLKDLDALKPQDWADSESGVTARIMWEKCVSIVKKQRKLDEDDLK